MTDLRRRSATGEDLGLEEFFEVRAERTVSAGGITSHVYIIHGGSIKKFAVLYLSLPLTGNNPELDFDGGWLEEWIVSTGEGDELDLYYRMKEEATNLCRSDYAFLRSLTQPKEKS